MTYDPNLEFQEVVGSEILLKEFKSNKMNSGTNIALNVLGTSLVADGIMRIGNDLKGGIVAVVLGIVVYIAYEMIPTKTV